MNELQVFNNPEFGAVRTLTIDGEPWAVGKDVAAALGYKNARDALKSHIDDEDKGVAKRDTLGGKQDMTIINESGIYSLILSSKLPNAKRFKHWVTSEILPALRKTGRYAVNENSPACTPRVITPDDYLTAARILSGCNNERLPYVLPLLRKAGIVVEISAERHTGKDPDTARLLNAAFNDYGVSIRELGRMTGIYPNQLCRMRDGTSRYNAERAAIVRDAIHALAPELDMELFA